MHDGIVLGKSSFHEILYLYLYRKYWKNAETAVELPGLSSWSIFLVYLLVLILFNNNSQGGRGARGCILTGQCTMYNVPGAKKLMLMWPCLGFKKQCKFTLLVKFYLVLVG